MLKCLSSEPIPNYSTQLRLSTWKISQIDTIDALVDTILTMKTILSILTTILTAMLTTLLKTMLTAILTIIRQQSWWTSWQQSWEQYWQEYWQKSWDSRPCLECWQCLMALLRQFEAISGNGWQHLKNIRDLITDPRDAIAYRNVCINILINLFIALEIRPLIRAQMSGIEILLRATFMNWNVWKYSGSLCYLIWK